ncbi:MAG: FG-GAP-like repeat-containing protein [Gammaproteobacteria bacterium]|nr:VCBS repeat-containing protein [Pseudomonadales bacterium]
MPKIMLLKNSFIVACLVYLCLSSNTLVAQLLKVPGQFTVGTSGAATYSIPIQVPPGTAGMQPSISLNYSSQGGNDIMGLGWSIGGLPSIQRCAPTKAQDDYDGGIHFAGGDRFCMSGQRLVEVESGTSNYWGPEYWINYVYRTEIDSYTKVGVGGVQGAGPEFFTAYTKSGQIITFGGTTNSRLKSDPTIGWTVNNSVRAWYVSKVTDRAGNYYEITYDDDDDGYLYPTRIDYTGNSSASLSPYNSIQFEYSFSRPDPIRMYQAGAKTEVIALLTNVKTYEGSNLVHDYQITYESGASEVRPSRVSEISLCDDTTPTPQCLPPTTFTWPTANDPISHLTPIDQSSSGIYPGQATNDYNGDGLPDFFREITTGGNALYWMSTEPGQWVSQSKDIEGLGYGDWIGYPAELNGDGFTDLVIDEENYSGPVRESNVINDGTGEMEYGQSGNGGANSAAIPFGDINGDGRDDLLFLDSNEIIPYYSDGDGTYEEGDDYGGVDSDSTVYAGDFNGDGCMDILEKRYGQESVHFISCGSSGSENISVSSDFVLGDFNGDGKTDILGGDTLHISKGKEFESITLSGASDWYKYQMHAGDFNGDGKSDVALIAASTSGGNYGAPTTHKVYLSTGEGFESSPSMTIANPSGSVQQANVHDFNGDDVADIWIKKSSSNYLYITDYEPQFITQINDGLGQSISITYDRLNDNSTSAGIYTKDTGATYPTLDVVGGQYVVSEYDLPNGIGGALTYSYEYEGLKHDQNGRGMLGFKKVIMTDPNSIVTTTTYKQEFPYIGLVEQKTRVSGSVTLSSVTNTYTNSSHSAEGGDRRKVFLDEKVEVFNDLNGTALPGQTTSYNYDSYGNTTWINIEKAGGKYTPGGSETTTSFTYSNNSSTWLIGRPEGTNTAYELYNSSTINRKTDIDTDSTTGLVTDEVVEPDITALKLTTQYTHDTYGNILTTTLSGVDITTQTTTNVYDAKGRFVTQITNAESHVEQFQNDPRFGGITSYTDPNSLVSTFDYDNFGRLTRETTPDGRSRNTSYSYCSGVAGGSASCPTNGAMEILKIPKRSDGTTQSGPAVKQVIDKLGRDLLAGTEAFNGTDWSISETFYDSLGRVQKTTSPYFDSGSATQYTTYSYDALARVTSSDTYPDSNTTTHTYNGLSTTVNNELNQEKTTVLNNQGLVASVTEEGDTTGSGDDVTTIYQYNAAGELIEVTDPDGNEITNTIDTRGRIT